jgi:hypothetical protein
LAGFLDFTGQGWLQLAELTLAFALSALVGLEREIRQKSAGLRTHTLVGVSAALFMLVSKYGFMNILENGRVVLDPSRVAAQVVSGIGFIGGGIIFMRRDVVRGLTTAASIWLTAALGMACGAGLPVWLPRSPDRTSLAANRPSNVAPVARNSTKPNHSLIQTSVGPLTHTAHSTYPSVASKRGDPGSGARKDFPNGSKMLQSHRSHSE